MKIKKCICKRCGREFEYKYGLSQRYKYCSLSCSNAADRENVKKYVRKNGGKIDRTGFKYLKTKSGLEVRNDILGQTMVRDDIVIKGRI